MSTERSRRYGRAFLIGIALNLAFVVIEATYGVLAKSVALFADAGHNLGDVLGLGLAWGATVLAARPASRRRTFGLRRSTIIASMANALTLLFVTGGIAWESVQRLLTPTKPAGGTMLVVALVGVVVNGASSLLFLEERHDDLNARSAFLHLASDAVLALGVAVAGGVIIFTGWLWLDPLVSLVLALTILVSTWSVTKASMNLMLDAVPDGIDPEHVQMFLSRLPGVVAVHDLHIWAMSTTETALTAHLVTPRPQPDLVARACEELARAFRINHATLQIELGTSCPLACEQARPSQ